MNHLRYALSFGIALLIISAFSEIDFTHFSFQNASFSLTKIAALLLAAYTLWSKRTAERLKDRKIVRNIRLLLTALLVYGWVQIVWGLNFHHFSLADTGYETTSLGLITLSLIVIWTSSVEELMLKD